MASLSPGSGNFYPRHELHPPTPKTHILTLLFSQARLPSHFPIHPSQAHPLALPLSLTLPWLTDAVIP